MFKGKEKDEKKYIGLIAMLVVQRQLSTSPKL